MVAVEEEYRLLLVEHRAFAAHESNYYQAFLKYKKAFYVHRGSDERRLILEALMHYYNKLDLLEQGCEPEDFTTLLESAEEFREIANYALQAERDKFFRLRGIDESSIAIMNLWMPPLKIS